jgi:pimeloyl-ACP methyl ester carboxylesterase
MMACSNTGNRLETQEQIMTSPPGLPAPSGAIAIFIGGFLDRSSRIVACYRKTFRRNYPRFTTFYFEHDQLREIISTVSTAKTANTVSAINLIGHSWGAVTAIRAANRLATKGINVDQVITIDPVGHGRISVATSTTAWINVNAAPAASNGWNGDYYAALGGKWGDWPRGKACVHYWAPCHHNEFAGLLEYVALDSQCALSHLIGA